jgi:hypothetical protein
LEDGELDIRFRCHATLGVGVNLQRCSRTIPQRNYRLRLLGVCSSVVVRYDGLNVSFVEDGVKGLPGSSWGFGGALWFRCLFPSPLVNAQRL